MAFDMLTKRRLFDSLWERARKGQRAPSLRLIVKECGLVDEAQAARLLTAMAGDGAISIVGEMGEYPWLTLRRNTYTGDFVSAPVWLERERDGATALEPEMADAPPVFAPITVDFNEYEGASGTSREDSGAVSSGIATRIPDCAPPSEPEVVTPLPAPSARMDRRTKEHRRNPAYRRTRDDHAKMTKAFSFKVHGRVFEAVHDMAKRQGVSASHFAQSALEQALTAQECDTGRRHKLRAAVLRAWRDDPSGLTLDAFVTGLIDLGLVELLRWNSRAEAAE